VSDGVRGTVGLGRGGLAGYGAGAKYAEWSTTVHVHAISVMVPWFDSIAYNAVMCSLPMFYGNEGMQPNSCQAV
jgi:hypothetical protein